MAIDRINQRFEQEWFDECRVQLTDERLAQLCKLRGFPINGPGAVPLDRVRHTISNGGLGWTSEGKYPENWVIPLNNVFGHAMMPKLWRPTSQGSDAFSTWGFGIAKSHERQGVAIGRILDLRWVLDHLVDAVEAHRGGGYLWFAEGEWDCLMLRCFGWLATTTIHGASSAPQTEMLLREFGGVETAELILSTVDGVIFVYDVDGPGQQGSVRHLEAFEKFADSLGVSVTCKAIDLRTLPGYAENGEKIGWDVRDMLIWSRQSGVKVARAMVRVADEAGIGVAAARELLDVDENVTAKLTLNDTMRAAPHQIELDGLLERGVLYGVDKDSRSQGAHHMGIVANRRGWLFDELCGDGGAEGHIKIAERLNAAMPGKDHKFDSVDAYKEISRAFLHSPGNDSLVNDLANVRRFVHMYQFFKLKSGKGSKANWMYWDGVRWHSGARPKVYSHCMRIADVIEEEAEQVSGSSTKLAATLRKFANACRNIGRINNVLHGLENSDLCRLDAEIGEAWDASAMLLGTPRGVFDLEKAELLKGGAARDCYCSMTAGGTVLLGDAGAAIWGDQWERGWKYLRLMLEQWFGDDDMVRMIQELGGLCLRGQSDEIIIVLQGSGRSGKSSLLDMFSAALGDYAYAVPGDAIAKATRGGGGAMSPLAKLSARAQMGDKRMVKVMEVGGRRLDVEMLKEITGELTFGAKLYYEDMSVANNCSTVFLMSNQELDLRGENSEAMRGRLWIVPMTRTFVHASRLSEDAYVGGVREGSVMEAKDNVKARLTGAATGWEMMPSVCLTWMYEGLARVIERGGWEVAAVCRERTSALWATTDVLGTYWLDVGLWIDGGETIVATSWLYNNVKSWGEQNDTELVERIGTVQQFAELLKTQASRGFEKVRSTKGIGCHGKQMNCWKVPRTFVGDKSMGKSV
jgi:phage/plasmid-associated DNA primase